MPVCVRKTRALRRTTATFFRFAHSSCCGLYWWTLFSFLISHGIVRSSRAAPRAADKPAPFLLIRLWMFSSANNLLKRPGYSSYRDHVGQTSTATNVRGFLPPLSPADKTTISDQSAVYSMLPHHLVLVLPFLKHQGSRNQRPGNFHYGNRVKERRGEKSIICCVTV